MSKTPRLLLLMIAPCDTSRAARDCQLIVPSFEIVHAAMLRAFVMFSVAPLLIARVPVPAIVPPVAVHMPGDNRVKFPAPFIVPPVILKFEAFVVMAGSIVNVAPMMPDVPAPVKDVPL